jgi:hypothetical protein
MSHLRILICRVEDESRPDELVEIERFDLPGAQVNRGEPQETLDELESRTLICGQEVMRHLLKAQWEEIDDLLVEEYREVFPPGRGDS